ncbi:MAG: YlbF family regulator, partial [Clostridia bacterium]|nr:YlbF family regulator [Clostridia bacterium]
MELIEMAAILGQRIRSSEAGQRLENAAKAYAENPELRSAFTEYQVQQKVLEEHGALEVKDEALISAIDKRLNEIYDQIINHEIYKEYEAAQEAYNN